MMPVLQSRPCRPAARLRAPFAVLLLLLRGQLAGAAARDLTGYQKVDLSNGLELFILENHVVPLASIEISFRCGSAARGPDTIGLFHLYEHMLFKGNRAYRTQTDFQAAMKEMGVASWNGSTGPERVTYYFTVPSDKVEKGIEFWANTVRYPLLDGRCLAGKVSASAEGKSGIGREADVKEEKGAFVPIAEALPFSKLQSVTRFYSGQQTNISVASQIASSIVCWGDCRDYLLMMGRISRVTAEDVLAAARRYPKDAPALWIALGDTKVLKDVKREDFTGSKTR